MKNLRLIAVAAGGLLVTGSLFLVACSDDTSVSPTKEGGSGTDGPLGFDSPNPQDDGGADTSIGETAPPFDAGLKVQTFAGNVAEKFCRSLARCCYGNANLDGGAPVTGGTYDQQKCLTLYSTLGFEGSNAGAVSIAAGNVELDQRKAFDCLTKVDALACDLPAAVLQDARSTCFAAFRGKLANSAPCRGSIECASGSFCKAPGPGNGGVVGTCEPLRGANGSCGDFTDTIDYAEEACSYRSGGEPALHCDTIKDFVAGELKPQAEWKCVPNVANGQNCAYSNWCASGICNADNLKCQTPLKYFDQSCPAYVK